MVLAKFKDENGITETCYLFDSVKDFNSFMFAPDAADRYINGIYLSVISGKYWLRKMYFRQLVIEASDMTEGLSYLELSRLQYWIEKNARRYGLLKEFKENGIL